MKYDRFVKVRDHDESKPGFSLLKKIVISALELKQNKNLSSFFFCFNTNAEIKNFFNKERPVFFHQSNMSLDIFLSLLILEQ